MIAHEFLSVFLLPDPPIRHNKEEVRKGKGGREGGKEKREKKTTKETSFSPSFVTVEVGISQLH